MPAFNPNSGRGEDGDPLTQALLRQRGLVPPSPVAPPPQVSGPSISAGNGTAASDAWWDNLKWDQGLVDKNVKDYTTYDVEGGGSSVGSGAYKSGIANNFDDPNKLTGAHGSLGSQGGMIPVPGKPGQYLITRQPPGNKSYNLVGAIYTVSPDGKSLVRTGEWSNVTRRSETELGQTAAKMAAIAATGAGLAASGALGAAAAGGVEASTAAGYVPATNAALAESAVNTAGYGASSAGAGGMTGVQLTPAAIEAAVNSPGYGNSAAADALVGPGTSGANAYEAIGAIPGATPPPTTGPAPPPLLDSQAPPYSGPPGGQTTPLDPPNTTTPSPPPEFTNPPISTPGIDWGKLVGSTLENWLKSQKGGGGGGIGSPGAPNIPQQLKLSEALRRDHAMPTMLDPNYHAK